MHEQLRSYALPPTADRNGRKTHSRRAEPSARGTVEGPEEGVDLEEITIGFPALETPIVGAIEGVLEKLDGFIEKNMHASRAIGFQQPVTPSGEAREVVDACKAAARFFGEAFEQRREQPMLTAFGQVTDAVEANLAMFLMQFTDDEISAGVSQDRLGELVRISILLRHQLRTGVRQAEQIQMAMMLQMGVKE